MADSSAWPELQDAAPEVARRLLGSIFIRELQGQQLVGRIVETEAYDQSDPASHTFRGQTQRNKSMFGPAGHLYVYFIYGAHYCMNVVAGKEGFGAGVLIRALEPLQGEAVMSANRGGMIGPSIANGPAKVCQALQVDRHLDGHDLRRPPLWLQLMPPLAQDDVVQTTRVGIFSAKDTPWRFYIKGSPYVSKV